MNFGVLIILAVVVVIVAAFLPVLLKLIGASRPAAAADLPYRKKDYLLTAAERSFCPDTTQWRRGWPTADI